MVKKLLFLILLLPILSTGQNNRKVFYGIISDSIGVVTNAHIINMNTKQGTFSNKNGGFKMFAKVNDSIRLSSVGYEVKTIIVSAEHFGISDDYFFLKRKTYQLDEVEIKKHNLRGLLATDMLKTPKDRKAEALEKVMNFSDVDWNATVKDDHIDKRVRPEVVRTDPNLGFVGAGASIYIPFGYSKRLWALRRKLAHNKSFPSKILSELGENFFFKELKIPIENYHHFLEYCNPLGIENLHAENKILEIITIFREQHISYLKIIKKE